MTTADRARLAAARGVVRAASPPTSAATYAAYVTVLFAAVYGVPIGQQVVRALDPGWVAAQLSATGLVVVAVGAGLVGALLAWRAGRVRGPVVPELPYLDLVVTTSIGREVSLGGWWVLSLAGCVFAGLVVGLVGAGSVAYVGLAPAWVLAPAAGGGAAVGVLVGFAWLAGQLAVSPPLPGGRRIARPLLHRLHLTTLRRQAASAVVVGGAVLAGDLRAVRLEVATPVTRARAARLRPRGRWGVIVARDLLGWRRDPGSVWAAVVLTVIGAGLLGALAGGTGVPVVLAVVGSLLLHMGLGRLSEGLRLHADTGNAPPLLGIAHRTEGLLHLVVPAVAAVVGCGVTALGLLAAGVPVGAALWPAALVPLLAAARLLITYRGQPPISLFIPNLGVPALVTWLAWPHVLAVASVSWVTVQFAGDGGSAGLRLVGLTAAVVVPGLLRLAAFTDPQTR